jgi:hypothetical protein
VLVNLTYKNRKGQITATSQGDLFSIWGATCVPDRPHPDGSARCLPDGNFCKGEREWNHYRVEGNNGRLTLAVNGHVVSGVSKCSPRKGYLALEAEGSECRFKNLKIKELPSTNPTPKETADVAKGFKSLYTGLDLLGWKAEGDSAKHWQARDGLLHYDGKGGPLTTERELGAAEFQIDFRFPKKGTGPCVFVLRSGKANDLKLSVAPEGRVELTCRTPEKGGQLEDRSYSNIAELKPAGQWNRLRVRKKGANFEATINDGFPVSAGAGGAAGQSAFALQPAGEMDFRSLFAHELKK